MRPLRTGLQISRHRRVGTIAPPPLIPGNIVAPVMTVGADGYYAGNTASCTQGTWTNSPTSFTYQWLANDINISGATSATLVIPVTAIGAQLSCRVAAINANGSGIANSNATRVLWSPAAEVASGRVARWLDTYDQSRVVRVGQIVSQLTGRANSINAVQATEAVKPTFVDASVNFDSHSVILFTGTTTGPFMEAPIILSGSLFMSLVVVRMTGSPDTISGARIVAMANTGVLDTGSSGYISSCRDGGSNRYRAVFGGTNVPEPGINLNETVITLARCQATQKSFSVNGRPPIVSAGAHTVNVTRGAIGANLLASSYGTSRPVMEFAESIDFTFDDDTVANKAVGYAAWRWAASLVTALPVDHPYKSAPP